MFGITEPVFEAPLLGFRASAGKIQLHAFVIRFDWGDLVEEIPQSFTLEALEGVELYFD
jgi:hypothetical protein